jgi:hypothetical protein
MIICVLRDFNHRTSFEKKLKDMQNDNLKKDTTTDENSGLAALNPLVNIGGDTIDLRKVERVGKVGGDSSWLRYSVYFIGGSEIEIYQERKYADNIELRQMKREKFVELWRSFNGR